MLKPVLIAIAATLSTSAVALASAADGLWNSPTDHGQVQIYDCAGAICGRVTDGDKIRANPDLRDLKNKDAAQQSRRLKGAVIMTGFHGGPSEWTGGQVYDPQSGNTYHGSVTLVDPNTLHLKGCIIGPLCKTQTWTRAR